MVPSTPSPFFIRRGLDLIPKPLSLSQGKGPKTKYCLLFAYVQLEQIKIHQTSIRWQMPNTLTRCDSPSRSSSLSEHKKLSTKCGTKEPSTKKSSTNCEANICVLRSRGQVFDPHTKLSKKAPHSCQYQKKVRIFARKKYKHQRL